MSLELETSEVQPYVKTSLVDVTNKLPFKPPCKVYFKNEYEQPSGSFKLRGIGNLIHTKIIESKYQNPSKKIHVFASSGGNAGLAAAYLAKFYGVPCTVAVPTVAKAVVINKLKEYNAQVIIFGDSINDADKYLKTKMELIDESIEKIYCHPFENELIWHGHSKLIDEISQDPQLANDKIKGVVCSIGGGGLYNGIMEGLIRNDINSDVLLIETKQAPTFAETIKKGQIFTLDSVKSLATSLACSYLSKQTLSYYLKTSERKTHFEAIDDFDAVKSTVQYFDNFNHLVEPACGAAVSVVLNRSDILHKTFNNVQPDDAIVIVVCGGSCTDATGLEEFKQMVYRNKL